MKTDLPKRLYGFTAPSMNSLFPLPPSIGDGTIPATSQPSEIAKALMSSHTAA